MELETVDKSSSGVEKDNNNRRFSRKEFFSKERLRLLLRKRLPILTWLPRYTKGTCLADAIAGITVGLTVVPQSMAYAAIAGLTPEYGLYSSYLGCFLYVLLGSCRQVTIGPTAIMGLLAFETCGNDFSQCVILSGFYSGIFELIMAFLQLGWVVSFISEPVTIGFTNAAAMTIMFSQVKNFLGYKGRKGSGFLGYCKSLYENFLTINMADATMGIVSLSVLILLKKIPTWRCRPCKYKRFVKKSLWLTSLARNIIVVLTSSVVAYLWTNPPFQLTGTVRGGLPPVGLPQFTLPRPSPPQEVNNAFATTDQPDNSTTIDVTEYMSFTETLQFLGNGPIIIALISVLQNVAISKSFGHGQSVDATQEMLALGVSNAVGGFFSAIPISGSFSRSAVNDASGVKTPAGGVYTGVLVLLSLTFLTPSFQYIPKSSLAAVIICAVAFMMEYKCILSMWKISRMDFMACFMTFCCCLALGMEWGILIGIGISLSAVIIKTLRPTFKYEIKRDLKADIEYLLIQPNIGGHFPSVEHTRKSISKLARRYGETVKYIVIDFNNWKSWDYSSASAFVTLNNSLKKMDNVVIFMNCTPAWIVALKTAGLPESQYAIEASVEEGWGNLINTSNGHALKKVDVEQ